MSCHALRVSVDGTCNKRKFKVGVVTDTKIAYNIVRSNHDNHVSELCGIFIGLCEMLRKRHTRVAVVLDAKTMAHKIEAYYTATIGTDLQVLTKILSITSTTSVLFLKYAR